MKFEFSNKIWKYTSLTYKIIIETKIFTRLITECLKDNEYRDLQKLLVNEPNKGKVIKNSNGLRKLRWNFEGKGKSGGLRIIYFYFTNKDIILMLFVYKKNETKDLNQNQIKILSNIINEEYKDE